MAKKKPKLHKEPPAGSKEYLEHESKESTDMERAEREARPDREKEEQEGMKGMHLKHPQVDQPEYSSEKAKHIMNDLASFLHHPQLGPKGPNLPPSKPKGK